MTAESSLEDLIAGESPEAEDEETQSLTPVEETTAEEAAVEEIPLESSEEEVPSESSVEEAAEESSPAMVGEESTEAAAGEGNEAQPAAVTDRTLVSTKTESHDYIYASGKLLRDTITITADGTATTQTLDFRYDENGYPYSMIRTSGGVTTIYYYITNLQGDVTYLVDGSGSTAASYTYDPYGNILTATGELAEVNPLRYRGYVYDEETGFYYVSSRYYDPETCRFINADSYVSTGQSFIGYNAFAYCGNNPVNRIDIDGEFWDTVIDVLSLGFSIGDVVLNPKDGWAWAGLGGDILDLIPFVTGIGEATRAASAVAEVADSVHDVAKTVESVDDVVDSIKPLHRPYIRKSVREAVEAKAARLPDGRFVDPNTKLPINGKYDLGHAYGHEFYHEQQEAMAKGWTQKQFNDYMNNPDFYQIEDISSNRSRKYEKRWK